MTLPLVSSGASIVSVGQNNVCALVGNLIRCWDSYYMFKPNPKSVDMSLPDSTISQIASDRNWSCAIVMNGAVKCWTIGGTTAGPVSTVIAAGATEMNIDINGNFCALVSSNLMCWVASDLQSPIGYALPDGTFGKSLAPTTIMTDVTDFRLANFSTYATETCVVKKDTSVQCWEADNNTPARVHTIMATGAATVHGMYQSNAFVVVGMKDGSVMTSSFGAGFTKVNLN